MGAYNKLDPNTDGGRTITGARRKTWDRARNGLKPKRAPPKPEWRPKAAAGLGEVSGTETAAMITRTPSIPAAWGRASISIAFPAHRASSAAIRAPVPQDGAART